MGATVVRDPVWRWQCDLCGGVIENRGIQPQGWKAVTVTEGASYLLCLDCVRETVRKWDLMKALNGS